MHGASAFRFARTEVAGSGRLDAVILDKSSIVVLRRPPDARGPTSGGCEPLPRAARHVPSTGPIVRPSETAAGRAADPRLAAHEELLVVLRGVGASMFLTSRRLIVARDGVERRPRSGLQQFDLVAIRHIRIELGSAPSGRIAVWTTASDQEALSMFFDARSLERAHELIDVARPLIARQRRERPGRPARPPIGPADPGSPGPSEPAELPDRN
jgi:hypothetical protein